METSELFTGLPVAVCKKILAAAELRNFNCGEVIYWVGDPSMEIFLLAEGRVKIVQQSENGSEIILRLHLPGQVMGQLGSTTKGQYTSIAQTLQACKTYVWKVPVFEALCERFPLLSRNTVKIISQQLSELSRRLCALSTGSVSPRLAHGLLCLVGQIGRKTNSLFELDITQEILAQMTGMTLFTANRQLSTWEKQGLVICRRNSIAIRDLSGLVQLCGRRKRAPNHPRPPGLTPGSFAEKQ
jgi:CRP-like cAMP-binding protein